MASVNTQGGESPITPVNVVGATTAGTSYRSAFVADVVRRRYPLAALAAALAAITVAVLFTTQLSTTLRVIYTVPGAYEVLAFTDTRPQPWADYLDLMVVQRSTFEHVLDGVAGGTEMGWEFVQARLILADVAALVKSGCAEGTQDVSMVLRDFVSSSKQAERSLQRFSSRTAGSVSTIIASTDYALHALTSLSSSDSSEHRSETVYRVFSLSMSINAREVDLLIQQAMTSVDDLELMALRLQSLHGLFIGEEWMSIELYALLGDHQLRNPEARSSLLQSVWESQRRAHAHIVSALWALREMDAKLADIGLRTVAPKDIGADIQLELHVQSVRVSLVRLSQKMISVKNMEGEARQKFVDLGARH